MTTPQTSVKEKILGYFHHVAQVSEDTSKEYTIKLLSEGQPQKIEIPDPDHYSWKRTEHGNLLIDWCAQDILPLELVDIISEDRNEEGSESDLDNSDYENQLSDSDSDTDWLSGSDD